MLKEQIIQGHWLSKSSDGSRFNALPRLIGDEFVNKDDYKSISIDRNRVETSAEIEIYGKEMNVSFNYYNKLNLGDTSVDKSEFLHGADISKPYSDSQNQSGFFVQLLSGKRTALLIDVITSENLKLIMDEFNKKTGGHCNHKAVPFVKFTREIKQLH
ncbi:hypothetical protein [Nonlabens xiamenensis]|uniref:hypothetical protein n=1 Tax=Nonlabens xiamenensis TaxID=2341043 RepID=UPI000F614078|nr:hypothetical protein [Nonlabens xiamenensis]